MTTVDRLICVTKGLFFFLDRRDRPACIEMDSDCGKKTTLSHGHRTSRLIELTDTRNAGSFDQSSVL
jgi:hypothetical protein